MIQKEKMKQGSALVFVIIAVAFVGILASIVLRATLVNVQTKRINSDMKKNQYTAETAMDDLNLSIQNIAAKEMKAAYAKVLNGYSTTVDSNGDKQAIQVQFAKFYLEGLISTFSGSPYKINPADTFDVQYDHEVINNAFNATMTYVKEAWKDQGKEKYDIEFSSPKNERNMELHFSENSNVTNYLILKNLTINFVENGYSTKITTDLKLVVPKINFEGGSIYPDFTKFCIIGDQKVRTETGNQTAKGSVYAGENGLVVGGNWTLEGSSVNLISRGDVLVNKCGAFEAGTKDNPITIWAENMGTCNNSPYIPGESEAKLIVRGDCYVHDDLNIDSSYSTVDIDCGSYYGYTFSKNNESVSKKEENSRYSSAILINGKKSTLKMGENINNILLGGRAFISKSVDQYKRVDDSDIMLGQAISVKSDQTFALVAKEYLGKDISNPMLLSKLRTVEQAANGIEDEAEYLNKNKIMSAYGLKTMRRYLNKTKPFIPYYYTISTEGKDACMVYFYYNFVNQQKANEYFAKIGSEKLIEKANNSGYLRYGDGADGINISQKLLPFTAAYANYFINEEPIDFESEDDSKFDKMDESILFSARYRSMQEVLSTANASKYETASEGYNDEDTGFNLSDKTSKRVFDSLITAAAEGGSYKFVKDKENADTNGYKHNDVGNYYYKVVPVKTMTDNGEQTVYAIFIVGNENDTVKLSSLIDGINLAKDILNIASNITINDTAIIVGNCNIEINRSIHGLVISSHQVSMSDIGVNITAESAILQAMFTAQKKVEVDNTTPASRKFLTYFKCFSDLNFGNSDESDSNIALSNYFCYQNWKKNSEK